MKKYVLPLFPPLFFFSLSLSSPLHPLLSSFGFLCARKVSRVRSRDGPIADMESPAVPISSALLLPFVFPSLLSSSPLFLFSLLCPLVASSSSCKVSVAQEMAPAGTTYDSILTLISRRSLPSYHPLVSLLLSSPIFSSLLVFFSLPFT